jgi:hypothetical protein
VPTNYPNGANGGLDDFEVTTDPGNTPLSQRGQGGNRNHVESHVDMGHAIEALQNYATLKTHDHSGNSTDPADRAKGYKLAQANTHQNADTNASASAIHHTLATHLPTSGTTGQFQAASGHHTHSYPTLTNTPVRLCTSTTRPTGVSVGTMIYETDTNRFRVWNRFGTSNLAVTGLDSTDSFDRLNTDNMGSTLWQQVYTPGSAGKMGTDGNHLAWYDSGTDPARCVARRINSADAVTQTDNQIITWLVGGTGIESYLPFVGGSAASNDMYFRMSTDGTRYLRLKFSWDEWGRGTVTLLGTQTGPAGEQRIGALATSRVSETNLYWVAELVENTVTVRVGPNLEGSTDLVGTITDANNVGRRCSANHTTTAAHTVSCVKYRGWGVGMEAGNRQGLDGIAFGQVTPAEISLVNIQDAVYYTGQTIWQLLPVANMPVVRLRQNSNQTINAGGSFIQWSDEVEDNFSFFSTTNSTSIVVTESGLYHLDVAIQWNPRGVPESGTVLAVINNVEQDLVNSAFQKSGTNTFPSFNQTLSLSGKIRLAAGDNLKIKVKSSNTGLLSLLSFFDLGSKINSRLDLTYVSP